MTEVGESRDSRQANKRAGKSGNPVSRLFGSLGLFISQILDELRKVVRPTRSELWNYTLVVIVFVSVMMALVSGMDFGFQKLVGLVFGNGG
ncbi:preprotein translocase subunit SecE [Knoellia locipacati]|uniref:preprotein translocase subunit SecE n=1 Tax=Knoellia locipacati TaxID=882824 RepID=UPI00384AB2EF